MKCFLIIYELRTPGRNYEALYNTIKAYGTWAKITDGAWAIVTDSTATQIRDRLVQFIDSTDRIFVIKSGHYSAWRNVIGSNDWFKKHLNKI